MLLYFYLKCNTIFHLKFLLQKKSCQFSAGESETNKKDIRSAKDDIKKLKTDCDQLKKSSKSYSKQASDLDEKLIDLQARSMRDNLMFYGIREGGDVENCDNLVKTFCTDVLHVDNAHDLQFDRVHRVGQKSAKTRPIVAKFHNYTDREKVRKASFTYAEQLKTAKCGVGAQLPKGLRDARKPLYPTMKEAKDAGKDVKFIGKKLFIDGTEYKSATPAPEPMNA